MSPFEYKCRFCGGAEHRCNYRHEELHYSYICGCDENEPDEDCEGCYCDGTQYCYETDVVIRRGNIYCSGIYDGYGSVEIDGINIYSLEYEDYFNCWISYKIKYVCDEIICKSCFEKEAKSREQIFKENNIKNVMILTKFNKDDFLYSK